jgi:hypothetical protein
MSRPARHLGRPLAVLTRWLGCSWGCAAAMLVSIAVQRRPTISRSLDGVSLLALDGGMSTLAGWVPTPLYRCSATVNGRLLVGECDQVAAAVGLTQLWLSMEAMGSQYRDQLRTLQGCVFL